MLGTGWWMVGMVLLMGTTYHAMAQLPSKGPPLVNGVLGKTVDIHCNVSARNDRVLLTLWYMQGVDRPIFSYDARGKTPRQWTDSDVFGDRASYISSQKTPFLRLLNVKESDESTYTCRVDYKSSPTQRASTRLVVIVPAGPPAILREDNVRVQDKKIGPYNEGTAVAISCQVQGGKPPPQVTWWREEQLADDEIDMRSGGTYRNTITIANLTRRHLGAKYVCQVTNHRLVQPQNREVILDVNLMPRGVQFVGEKRPLVAGQEETVRCRSWGGRPHAIITWFLDGEPMPEENYVTRAIRNGTLSKLQFTPSEKTGKMLVCRAESPVVAHQPLEATWKLDVHRAPKVVSLDVEVPDPTNIKEHDNVTLRCKVDAHPPADVINWYHDGMLVQDVEGNKIKNNKLVLEGVELSMAGVYTCIATNAVGDGESDPYVLYIKYSPVCSIKRPIVVGLAKNEAVEVACNVMASPPLVTFKWMLSTPNDIINLPEDWYSVEDRSSKLTYQLGDLYGYGELLCYARNELGEQMTPCRITLEPAKEPEAVENCTLANNTEDSLHIACTPGYDGGVEQEFVVLVREMESNRLVRNETRMEPVFALEGLLPGSSYVITVFARNSNGKSAERVIHGFTLPTASLGSAVPATHIFPITPILGVLIGVIGALVVVAVVVVVVMKLRSDTTTLKTRGEGGIKPPHSPLAKDEDGPDVILCRTDSTYEDVDGIPQKLKHANIYETVPYDNNDKNSKNSEGGDADNEDEVEYAELSFTNGKSKTKAKKANGNIKPYDDSTIYATIDHTRTAVQQEAKKQQEKQKKAQEKKQQQEAEEEEEVEPALHVDTDNIPLMDAALESSV